MSYLSDDSVTVSCISPVSDLTIFFINVYSLFGVPGTNFTMSLWAWDGVIYNNKTGNCCFCSVLSSFSVVQALKWVLHNTLCGHLVTETRTFWLFACLLNFRCPTHRQGGVVCSEAAPVLCTVWLRDRSSQWSQVQRGEACWTEWDGGVHHTQSWCSYWMHLPRGCHYGESTHAPTCTFWHVWDTGNFTALCISILCHVSPEKSEKLFHATSDFFSNCLTHPNYLFLFLFFLQNIEISCWTINVNFL